VEDQSANLVLASMRAVFRLSTEGPRKVGFHLGSGIGLVNRGGDAWADTPQGTAFAFVASAGGRAQLNPRRGISFRLELEDYISWARFRLEPGSQSRGRPYHDLIWSLGLNIPLSVRR
jgi:hypothetical protein